MSLLPNKYVDAVSLVAGKNASVYKARNSFLNREVFLKIYKVPENDPNSALKEPQLLQSLRHDNLAGIFSADVLSGGMLLLEMELITGGSIQDLLDQTTQSKEWPSIFHALELIVSTARGLSELHDKGLVHRDIKPANVMIRKGQNRDHAVVTDLGLASTLDSSGRAFSSRHARIYRPPEVWNGNGYSKSSDVYQLGIVLYQLLGGTVPYDKADLDDTDLSTLTVSGSLFDLTDIGPHVDRTLRTLIGKCVCPEISRIPTMPDFISTVQTIKNSHLNWIYSAKSDGFTMTRTAGDRKYTISVRSTGKKHFITGKKIIGNASERRLFKDQIISHADLGRSQEFRDLIKKS
jgi:serine/threonine protein kinase